MIFSLLLSFKCFAYITIPGMVLNDIGKTTVVNASVFLGDDSAGNNQQKLNVKYDTTYSEKVVTKLKNFSIRHITEKAYLHFDKPYYAAGDTIYFKAYITMGERHELSNLSGVLHVDLINTNNKINRSIKLKLDNGLAWGDFTLPDSLPKGNYRVRAYTQWMRNSGDSSYFDQAILVGSAMNSKILESGTRHIPNIIAKTDLQFFPEGGELVTGILSKVAFKAIGVNGLGIDVRGVVTDNENKEVTSFVSSHLGMGYFYLSPTAGKTYTASLSYPNGSQTIYDLPMVKSTGIVLSINNDSIPKATVCIKANATYCRENRGKEYVLLIYSGGIATTVTFKLDSPTISLDILKRRLHTGIATVTLFSPLGKPLSERLIFVQNYNQLNLAVSSDKPVYTKRGKVTIKLNAKTRGDSAAPGHFSISVIDESKVPVDENNENTILTSLLLTSDLKGYIEQPNYYFGHVTDITLTNLDLVMLTHGYRRFEWKKLLNNDYSPIVFQPENGLEIAGITKTLGGKPIANGTVTLISPAGGPVLSQQTDNKGNFRFSNLIFFDTTRFILSATNAKGKNLTQITYNKDYPDVLSSDKNLQLVQLDPNKAMQAYLENSEKQLIELNKFGFGKVRMLKEVKIKGKKRDDDYPSSSLLGPGHADQVIHSEDIAVGGPLSTRLMGKLKMVNWVPITGGRFIPMDVTFGIMKVIIDGASGNLDDISGSSVETIEVLRGANGAIYGGLSGVILITTKRSGLKVSDIIASGILPITANGFYKAREFYAPEYEHPDDNINRKDLRSTIYWKPEIVTDKDGNASFEYYNADGTGNYRVTVEGIDEKGNIGRQVFRYKVE